MLKLAQFLGPSVRKNVVLQGRILFSIPFLYRHMPKGHIFSLPNYYVVQKIRWSFHYYSRERGII
jgi:hypothetical protein